MGETRESTIRGNVKAKTSCAGARMTVGSGCRLRARVGAVGSRGGGAVGHTWRCESTEGRRISSCHFRKALRSSCGWCAASGSCSHRTFASASWQPSRAEPSTFRHQLPCRPQRLCRAGGIARFVTIIMRATEGQATKGTSKRECDCVGPTNDARHGYSSTTGPSNVR